jgi:cellulose synthase/poly-beta-1,6-N-acetylglucosamine synthase-like glycosyltransferase
MVEFCITIALVLVASAIGQGCLAIVFVWALFTFRRRPIDDRYSPRTSMVLCLRGRDPFLETCLDQATRQDYPDYQLRMVVDNREDPAWDAAQSLAGRCGAERVHVETLTERRDTCTLKCSSLVQAIEHLDPSCEVVALLDADTMPHAQWLRQVTAPLADERVGAATGNRWYMPESASWGGLVRYLWNAAAVVQMYCYEIAWAGTLAVKRNVIDDAGLLERWRHAFCEDTMLRHELSKRGMRVKFVPSLMMVNREDISVSACLSWIRRQLLNARLYHPHWPLVLFHGVSTVLVLFLALAAVVAAAIAWNGRALAWVVGGLLTYELIMVSLLVAMELAVRRIVRSRGGATGWISLKTLIRLAPAIALTQVVYTIALIGAQFMRRVDWRGVNYDVAGPWDIRRIDDPSGEAGCPCAAEGHSL